MGWTSSILRYPPIYIVLWLLKVKRCLCCSPATSTNREITVSTLFEKRSEPQWLRSFFFGFFVDPTHSPNKRGHPKNKIPKVSYRSILIKLKKQTMTWIWILDFCLGPRLTSRFFSHPRSRGGDLFTDFDAEASEIYGAEVHSGVLSAAVALERELRRELW